MLSCIYQIADAMAYLEKRRVIHRDLAARFDHDDDCVESCHFLSASSDFHFAFRCSNVLVGFDGLNEVKLNDLGLSRSLTTSAYYRKTGNELVCLMGDNVFMLMESLERCSYCSR